MILVFAGAGASLAVDKKLYPTTVQFFKRLPDDLKTDPVFHQIVKFFEDNIEHRQPDIEELIWLLGELQDDFKRLLDDKKLIGWLLKENLIRLFSTGKEDNCSKFRDSFQRGIQRIKGFYDVINRRVFGLYGTEPPSESIEDNWILLLKALSERTDTLELFTTNYDLVIEKAIASIKDLRLKVLSGRDREKKVREVLQLKHWDRSIYNHDFLRFTKLHGSVDWYKEQQDGEIFTQNIGFRGDHKKHIIVYPGFKSIPEEEPFITFHKHLQETLQLCESALFIGYAFRDNYINELLVQNMPNKTTIFIIDPAKALPNVPFDSSRLHHFQDGFNRSTVESVINNLTKS